MIRRFLIGGLLFVAATASRAASADEAAPASDDFGARVPWRAPNGRAVSLSYENGLFGGTFEQGIRVKIPFHANWGMVARPMFLHDVTSASYRGDVGGRLELYGASPVFLNFARIYGGGGAQVFQAVSGLANAKPAMGGGGHFGFEFFYTPRSSFFIEIGGTSGAQGGVGAGGTAIAGVTFYPFAESPRQVAAL